MKKYLTNSGFTLIEIMIVLAIISILVLLIVPNATGIIESANNKGCDALTASKEALEITEQITGAEASVSEEDLNRLCDSQ